MSILLSFPNQNTKNHTPNTIDSQTLNDTKTINLSQIKKPSMYKVIMLNDDFTPMDFVVYILEVIFQKNNKDAIEIMFKIHNTGIGNCGVFTYEIAKTKQTQVIEIAKKNQHPLQCVLEKE